MEKECINLVVPRKPEYVGVVRLTTSAIANNVGFNIDEIDDIRVAISEACTNAMESNIDNLSIQYRVSKGEIDIDVKGVIDVNDDNISCKERKLGIMIIKSLMDHVRFTDEGINMIKKQRMVAND